MILIRFFLIGLIIFLIVRSFRKFGDGNGPSAGSNNADKDVRPASKKISREIGEYIDYEELRK